MAVDRHTNRLPSQVDHLLRQVSQILAQDGERLLQEVVVNARPVVTENFDYDGIDGGVWGHRLVLVVPEALFLATVRNRHELTEQLRSAINSLVTIPDEYISSLDFEAEPLEDSDWRAASGLLKAGARYVSATAASKLWPEKGFRVFLSHKSSVKRETAALKDALAPYGAAAFVAHEDIRPTKAWQSEIETALATCDALVALLTPDFHDSDWTDQEVGFAFAQGIPIIAVMLGLQPYGFIGKFQALKVTWDEAPLEIVRLLTTQERMVGAYVHAVATCQSWNQANDQALLLPHIESLSRPHALALIDAFNKNSEVRGGWGFNGRGAAKWGPGLVHYLNRLGHPSKRVDDQIVSTEKRSAAKAAPARMP